MLTLPFQISHSALEWSSFSNLRPLPSVKTENSLVRPFSSSWFHFTSFPWKCTALQYDWYFHPTVACVRSHDQLSLEHGTGDPRINELMYCLRYTIDFRLTLVWRQYSISNKSKEVVFLFIVFAWHEVGGTEKWPNIFNPSSFPSWQR